MQARPETLAYMALINPTRQGKPDAIGVVDLDPASKSYGRLVGQTDMPNTGDELHHFGWNACSACLCPYDGIFVNFAVLPGLTRAEGCRSDQVREGHPLGLRRTEARRLRGDRG